MRLGATLLLALLGTLAPVTAAGAHEPRAQAFPGYRQISFTVRGSAGYRIQVSVGHGSANLFVSKSYPGLFNSATSFYSTRSELHGSRIDADFGRFGHVSGAFEQRGGAQKMPNGPECEGGGSVRRFGRFVGSLVFHGEQRYSEARVSSAKAESIDTPPLRCDSFGPPKHQGKVIGQGTRLALSCANPSFSASTEGAREEVFPGGIPAVEFSASTAERVGPIRVMRLATAGGPAPTFLFDEGLSSSTVSPPPPFRGSATFSRGPGGATDWSGDLTVDLPGASVGLVRPDAQIDLSHFPIRAQTGAAAFITVERCKGHRGR